MVKNLDFKGIGKKGFMKTLEIFLMIMIVIVFFLYTSPARIKTVSEDSSVEIFSFLKYDNEFRNEVYSYDNTCLKKGDGTRINEIIDPILEDVYNYTLCISDNAFYEDVTLPDVQIFTDGYFYGGNKNLNNPKMVRIYYWIDR